MARRKNSSGMLSQVQMLGRVLQGVGVCVCVCVSVCVCV